ncbi:MAG TPA: hypothetical protein VHL79_15595 [Ramlibacter sp.]|jgi:hypothetical protein|nr:hypothetical protein [Ramlibacter sp.]
MRLPLLLLVAAFAGCAAVPREDARLSEALVRLADVALTTAENDADIREVVRRHVAGVRGHQVAFIGGRRFVVLPATLDRSRADPRHRNLIAQSLELAEESCYSFAPVGTGPEFVPAAPRPGTVTLTARAERVQFVNVAIEIRHGCISAIHFEQVSALPRD